LKGFQVETCVSMGENSMAESPRVIDNVEISKRHFLGYATQPGYIRRPFIAQRSGARTNSIRI
jgi:hypothetical protein